MEITLRLPTGDKIFTQNTVNFLTIKKALEWMKRFTSTQKHMIELAQAGIQGEVLEEEVRNIYRSKGINLILGDSRRHSYLLLHDSVLALEANSECTTCVGSE